MVILNLKINIILKEWLISREGLFYKINKSSEELNGNTLGVNNFICKSKVKYGVL